MKPRPNERRGDMNRFAHSEEPVVVVPVVVDPVEVQVPLIVVPIDVRGVEVVVVTTHRAAVLRRKPSRSPRIEYSLR